MISGADILAMTPRGNFLMTDYKCKLNDYPHLHISNLVSAISYEPRGTASLARALNHFDVEKVKVLRFNVEQYLNEELYKEWKEQEKNIYTLLEERQKEYEVIRCQASDFGKTIQQLKEEGISQQKSVSIIDITTLPKNYILGIAKEFDSHNNLFLYTRSKGHRTPKQDERFIGVSQIVVVDGFGGEISLEKEDLLILILGFEGNRAFSFISEFATERIVAVIGAPRTNKENDDFYISTAKKCNEYLLNNSAVLEIDQSVHSYDHVQFCKNLEVIVATLTETKSYNICISPLGTKAQTLGLYLYWRNNKETQILYAIPNERISMGSEAEDTWVYKI